MTIKMLGVAAIVALGLAGCARGGGPALADTGVCYDDFSCAIGFSCEKPEDAASDDPGQCVARDDGSCLTDDDCTLGTLCLAGFCQTPGGNNANNGGNNANNGGNNGNNGGNNGNNGGNNANNGQEPVCGDAVCDPSELETCVADCGDPNACRDNTECDPSDECCAGSCVPRGNCRRCSAHGEPCDLPVGTGLEQQGQWYCAAIEEQGPGTCLSSCTEDFTADICPTGSYCLDVGQLNPVLVCLPSQCQTSGQCTGLGENRDENGTCIAFDNNAGYCFTAGNAIANSTCTPGSDDPNQICQVDHFCLTEVDQQTGTCRPLCDFWGASSCPGGQACGLLTLDTGVCFNTTSQGQEPFDECAPIGDWCSPGNRCFELQTPPNRCLVYCRIGNGADCNGVSFQGTPATCQEAFQDDTTIGLCFP